MDGARRIGEKRLFDMGVGVDVVAAFRIRAIAADRRLPDM
jgi:hypothetical protein